MGAGGLFDLGPWPPPAISMALKAIAGGFQTSILGRARGHRGSIRILAFVTKYCKQRTDRNRRSYCNGTCNPEFLAIPIPTTAQLLMLPASAMECAV